MTTSKQDSKFYMVAVFTAFVTLSILALYLMMPTNLAAQFGISTYAAKKVINIVSGAGSIWAIIAVVGGSAGWGAALLAVAKALLKKFGKVAAASW